MAASNHPPIAHVLDRHAFGNGDDAHLYVVPMAASQTHLQPPQIHRRNAYQTYSFFLSVSLSIQCDISLIITIYRILSRGCFISLRTLSNSAFVDDALPDNPS